MTTMSVDNAAFELQEPEMVTLFQLHHPHWYKNETRDTLLFPGLGRNGEASH